MPKVTAAQLRALEVIQSISFARDAAYHVLSVLSTTTRVGSSRGEEGSNDFQQESRPSRGQINMACCPIRGLGSHEAPTEQLPGSLGPSQRLVMYEPE